MTTPANTPPPDSNTKPPSDSRPQKRAIKQQRAEKTRGEILDAAIREFAHRSFEGTSMVQLARAIHMTPGALYWHFPTKEDLLLAAIEELHSRFMKDFDDLLRQMPSMTARQQLLAFFDRVRNFFRYHPEYGRFYSMAIALSSVMNERIGEAIRGPLTLYCTIFEKIIRYGQNKTGEFRRDVDPVAFGHCMVGMFSGLILQQGLFQDRLSYDVMALVLDRIFADGMNVQAAAISGPVVPMPGALPSDAGTP